MIHQLDFNGLDKVDKAIMRLQTYEPPEGYYLCFSGGKDSVVIKALADMAGGKEQAREFEYYPKYKGLYLKAFEKMLENNRKNGIVSKQHWETAEDVMQWWMQETKSKDESIIIQELQEIL